MSKYQIFAYEVSWFGKRLLPGLAYLVLFKIESTVCHP